MCFNRTVDDNLCDVDGFQSLSIKVEYHRSIEYHLKWESHMHTRRFTRLQNNSNKNIQDSAPSPNEDVIQRQLRRKKRQTWLSDDDGVEVNTEGGRSLDIIDLIDGTHNDDNDDKEHVNAGDDGKFAEIADNGVDESDEDCGSDNSSIVSGPSLLNSSINPKPLPGLCLACRKLYQKAKKMKKPIKDKPLDTDPLSLTCDQWVLLKKWTPRRLPDSRGNLLMHVKKRLMKKDTKQNGLYSGDSSVCSRPHTILQRNLRRCIKTSVKNVKKRKKKNGKKRARDDSQVSRVAKQKRLHGDNPGRSPDINFAHNNGHSSSPSSEGWHNEESNDPANMYVTELVPFSVTFEPSVTVPAKQTAVKNTPGFRDLLAQFCGNSSLIVRETR